MRLYIGTTRTRRLTRYASPLVVAQCDLTVYCMIDTIRDAFTFLIECLTWCTVQVSLDYYRRESAKIIAIFKECLPDGEIGKLGYVVHHRAPPLILLK